MTEVTKDQDYNIWSDPKYDSVDFKELMKQEYADLGFNPRELKPVGHEKV